jgi:hypothetical protein
MNDWVQIKGTKVQGPVVAKVRRPEGLVLGVDVNGEGGIYYVMPSEVAKIEAPAPTKKVEIK